MIKKFLKAKHWQLFVLMFGIPFVVQAVGMVHFFSIIQELESLEYSGDVSPTIIMDSMMNFAGLGFSISILMGLLLFGWLWSVGIGLQDKIADELKLSTGLFKAALIFPAIYLGLIMGLAGYVFFNIESLMVGAISPSIIFTIFPLHFLTMIAMIYSLYFVAQTIKTVEFQRKVSFGDFIGEFFLVWFFPIGVWILQPKINEWHDNQIIENDNHEVEF